MNAVIVQEPRTCRYCREQAGYKNRGPLKPYPYKGKQHLFHEWCFNVGIPGWEAAAQEKEPDDPKALRDIFMGAFWEGVAFHERYCGIRPDLTIEKPWAGNKSMSAWGEWYGFEAARRNDLNGTPATPTRNHLGPEVRHYENFMAEYRPNQPVHYDTYTKVHYYREVA